MRRGVEPKKWGRMSPDIRPRASPGCAWPALFQSPAAPPFQTLAVPGAAKTYAETMPTLAARPARGSDPRDNPPMPKDFHSYDVIVVETVGVGQNEVAVSEMVDTFLMLPLARPGDQ